jgi:hypothetical protein
MIPMLPIKLHTMSGQIGKPTLLRVQCHNTWITTYVVSARVARWIIFKPKIPIWLNFGGPQIGKCLYIYFMAIWNIIRRFWIFYYHLVHFVFIWYIFSSFGIKYQEKSGNPGWRLRKFKKTPLWDGRHLCQGTLTADIGSLYPRNCSR